MWEGTKEVFSYLKHVSLEFLESGHSMWGLHFLPCRILLEKRICCWIKSEDLLNFAVALIWAHCSRCGKRSAVLCLRLNFNWKNVEKGKQSTFIFICTNIIRLSLLKFQKGANYRIPLRNMRFAATAWWNVYTRSEYRPHHILLLVCPFPTPSSELVVCVC